MGNPGGSAGLWKNDPFYRKAKSMGYRSRAAFKLIGIDEKFNIFKLGPRYATNILDLGCHPGSFIQYILEKYRELMSAGMVKGVHILGIDKTTTKPFDIQPPLDKNCVSLIRADIMKFDIEDVLKEWTKQYGKFGLIISDLAPKTTGDFRDAALQEEMVLRVFDLLLFMRRGGNAVIKIFESPETQNLVKKYSRKFKKVKLTKPAASRPKSREKFLVCLNYL